MNNIAENQAASQVISLRMMVFMVDGFVPCSGLQANTSSAGEKNVHVRWRAERGPGAMAG